MTAPWMPPLPERPWSMFCTKCMQRRRLDDTTKLQRSKTHPGVAFAACPCGYSAFAEQDPYTADQMRQAQADAARAALEQAAKAAGPEDSYRDEWFSAKADSVAKIRALAKEITP